MAMLDSDGILITQNGISTTSSSNFTLIENETIGKRYKDGTYTITRKIKQNKTSESYTGLMISFNLLL